MKRIRVSSVTTLVLPVVLRLKASLVLCDSAPFEFGQSADSQAQGDKLSL
jgi:hypothetical protein